MKAWLCPGSCLMVWEALGGSYSEAVTGKRVVYIPAEEHTVSPVSDVSCWTLLAQRLFSAFVYSHQPLLATLAAVVDKMTQRQQKRSVENINTVLLEVVFVYRLFSHSTVLFLLLEKQRWLKLLFMLPFHWKLSPKAAFFMFTHICVHLLVS